MQNKNDIERSLLQKAIRRGNVELTEKVVNYLMNHGDKAWLKSRLEVIAYEECWTYADQISKERFLECYKDLARAVKNKDAAGLAEIAVKLSDSKFTLPDDGSEEVKAITAIMNAINNPEQFWEWIKKEGTYARNIQRITKAENAIGYPVFPAEKVMTYAAAYLMVKDRIPATEFSQQQTKKDFPYWVAIDKHTGIGKQMIAEACKEINFNPYNGSILSFYMEGSLCNETLDSYYWNSLVVFSLGRMRLKMEEAITKWEQLKPIIIEKTKPAVEQLLVRLETT